MKKYCPYCSTTTEHTKKRLQWIPLSILSFGMAYGGFSMAKKSVMLIMVIGGAVAGAYLVYRGVTGGFKTRYECNVCKTEN